MFTEIFIMNLRKTAKHNKKSAEGVWLDSKLYWLATLTRNYRSLFCEFMATTDCRVLHQNHSRCTALIDFFKQNATGVSK